jgi:hypothetical protein
MLSMIASPEIDDKNSSAEKRIFLPISEIYAICIPVNRIESGALSGATQEKGMKERWRPLPHGGRRGIP